MTTRDKVRAMLCERPMRVDAIARELQMPNQRVQSHLSQLGNRGEAFKAGRGIQGRGGFPATWAITRKGRELWKKASMKKITP